MLSLQKTPSNSFFEAVGVASGNAQLFGGLALALLLAPLIQFFLTYKGEVYDNSRLNGYMEYMEWLPRNW